MTRPAHYANLRNGGNLAPRPSRLRSLWIAACVFGAAALIWWLA